MLEPAKKIRLSTTEVLLRATIGDLSSKNNLRNWEMLNVILLLPFITKEVVTEGETQAAELLKTLDVKIPEQG